MLIQYLLVFLVLLMVIRVIIRWKQGLLDFRDFIFWLAFWAVVGIVVILPEVTSFFAILFGVGRGADLVVYLSIVLIFYIIFQITVKIEKMERNIAKIVREIALNQKDAPLVYQSHSDKKTQEQENKKI